MDYRNLRIVFMGTPDFAVASLDALVQAGCTIAGVITAPDKPAGRGMKLTGSAVKKYALEKGLYMMQPEKLKTPEFIEELKNTQADLQVVVAFRMLPEIVWDMPPMGTINVHGSLLPAYRGAAPINWAIINGERITGITTFKLQHQIDTGNILLQQTIPIGDDETAGELHDVMKETGAQLLVQTIQQLAQHSIAEMAQSNTVNEKQLHAPKITTETCRINWMKPVSEIYNLVRGLSPYPTAFTFLQEKTLKLYRAKKEMVLHTAAPGSFETDGKTYLRFAGVDGYLYALDVQLEGKKRMGIGEFLRGYRLNEKEETSDKQ